MNHPRLEREPSRPAARANLAFENLPASRAFDALRAGTARAPSSGVLQPVHGFKARNPFSAKSFSMNCVNGNFDSTFPLTPSLSLGERVNHFAPLVGTSRAMNLKPSRQRPLPLPKGEGWGEGEGSARNQLLAGLTHAFQNHTKLTRAEFKSAKFLYAKSHPAK